MIRVIVLMFFVAVIGCHESNSVEPVLDNSAQLNRMDGVNGTLDNPLKNGDSNEIIFIGNSCFNPAKKIGKVLNGTLKYTIDNEAKEELFVHRYFNDAKVETQSQMVINNKTFPTKNVYVINRVERTTKSGKVISGKTWGTFKIHEIGGHKPAIFQGEFTGEIKCQTTNIKLKGKGLRGNYLGRVMEASEQLVCTASGGELQCWTSNVEGTISSKVLTDN